MKASILLITGWGGGEQLLSPLKQALQQKNYQVHLINIFNALEPKTLDEYIQLASQYDVIAGWSLGGELAIVLSHEILKRTGQGKTLITMATNPCFVTTKAWPCAMSVSDFAQFMQSFDQEPVATLKRFGLLITKGVNTAKKDFVTLQSLLKAQSLPLLKQGLTMLEQFNLVETIKNYPDQQLHIFAEQDALVPGQIYKQMQQIAAKNITVTQFSDAAHSFPLIQAEKTCEEIINFIVPLI